ncbi:diguanylate cyclase [Halothiobacillus sp. DCM-1]|uniref:sensor domain-containing diguanylate cyclase n=1 Tax=Halothiobacillus sp. DCM-1 TaxID=3112558 RepID=UPI0032444308
MSSSHPADPPRAVKLGLIDVPLFSLKALGLSLPMALGYIGLAWIVVHFFPVVSPFWPAAALAVAGVMLFGAAMLPAIFIGAFVANFSLMDWSWFGALIAASGNTLSPWLGVWLFRRLSAEDFFDSPKAVGFYFVLVGLLASALSAVLGIFGLSQFHTESHGYGYLIDGLGWLVGDLTSTVMLAPALYLWGRFALKQERPHPAQYGTPEFLLLLVVMVGGGLVLFGINTGGNVLHIGAMSLVVPPLIWAAQRFSPRLALTLFAGIYLVATGCTLAGMGPFVEFSPGEALTALQLMGASISSSVLIASVLDVQRRDAHQSLELANSALNERVWARTRELAQSEQRTRYILEMMPMPMLVTELATSRVLFVNDECLSLFGATRADVKTVVPRDLWVDPSERVRVIARLQQGEVIRNHEVAFHGLRGEVFWLSIAVVLTRIEQSDALMFAFKDISLHKKREAELLNQATIDLLTGLYNRRQIRELVRRLMLDAETRTPVALAIIDLDHFKRINDGSGHACGDKVLQTVAEIGRSVLRSEDWFGRWGGEEFVVVFPGLTSTQAEHRLDTLRRQLMDAVILCDNGHLIQLTASFGLTEGWFSPDRRDFDQFDEWINEADLALYRAKNQGRNRIERA